MPSHEDDHEILPPDLAIKAMRDGGYKDAAHALAELIDNSIQAGLDINKCTRVELITLDEATLVREREMSRIQKVAVYDNACGMDAADLRKALQFGNGSRLAKDKQSGMGKFGMGLPNASISRCTHVDVYTWQRHGHVLYTYLDIGEIQDRKMRAVPSPKPAEIPKIWLEMIADKIGEHGTLVVWSGLDRIGCATGNTLLKNSEFVVGRMYRKFINDGRAEIHLSAWTKNGSRLHLDSTEPARVNDPMFLMKGTCAPAPYSKEPAFTHWGSEKISCKSLDGEKAEIIIDFSIARTEVRAGDGGASPISKQAAKNQGVSLVRADRELELDHSFENRYDPRERWWGVEVRFSPILDGIFGVTNNKQHATNFLRLDLDSLAETEGITAKELLDSWKENQDPQMVIAEVSRVIDKNLSTIRDQIKRQAASKRKAGGFGPLEGSAEDISTKATRARQDKLGKTGHSDRDENLSEAERKATLAKLLEEGGESKGEAEQIAIAWAKAKTKFIFQKMELPGQMIFDVKSSAGTIVIIINVRHPACEGLYEALENASKDGESPELRALKLLFTAWGRMEDEATEKRKGELEDIRMDWGKLARDFLQAGE